MNRRNIDSRFLDAVFTPNRCQSSNADNIRRKKQLKNQKNFQRMRIEELTEVTMKNRDVISNEELSVRDEKFEKNVIPNRNEKVVKTLSLDARAEKLKSKVYFCNIDGNLAYFNGKCYDILSSADVIKLYRKYVNFTLDSDKNMTSISQLYSCLCSDTTIPEATRKRNLRLAILKNGVYDVVNQKLLPHSLEYKVCYYIDANFISNAECPEFDDFLYQSFEGNKTYIKRFWMALGYLLMETLEGKVFFFMGLAPNSGKSVVGRFIESLFPERYVSNIELNDFNRNFAIAPIVGSALNTALDMPATKLNVNAVSKLKKFTGGDAFNVNQKYMAEFKYRNTAKFLFASNFPISLYEDDTAFWQRVIYLPFNLTVPCEERRGDLLESFQCERDAIVSKALKYANKLIKNNFQFPTDSELEKTLLKWRCKSSDSIEKFLSDQCIISDEYRGELVKNLYDSYVAYCGMSCDEIVPYVTFKKFLQEEVGLPHFKMRDGGENTQSAFRGIKLL